MAPTTKRKIAFIDCNVDDPATLLAGIRPEVEAILLSDHEPAALQIAQVVTEREELSAIHIIAHGSCGEVHVGDHTLALETLEVDEADLKKIGKVLGADGDLLLWSCAAAKAARGAAFVRGLAPLTAANVMAASGLVGSPVLGGQWELDVVFGDNQHASAAPLTAQAMASYLGILADNRHTTWCPNAMCELLHGA
jgi:hypothetical protein